MSKSDLELESTQIFVKVVQQGSFSRAAAILKLPVSTVSRAISRLEAEVGTTLMHRTTRSLKLTSEGQSYFDASVGPLQQLEEARKSLHGRGDVVSGLIKISATEDMGSFVVTPVIARVMKVQPALTFEFDYTNEVVDLVKGGYDIAVRVGRLNSSRFKSRKLGEISIVAVASPAYLARKPKIRKPNDLVDHDCIAFTPASVGFRWTLSQGGKTVVVPAKAKAIGNQMQSLISLAVEGGGVALVPHFACKSALASGGLVRVLPEWSSPGFPVSLIFPNTGDLPARVKIVADELARTLQEVLGKPV